VPAPAVRVACRLEIGAEDFISEQAGKRVAPPNVVLSRKRGAR